jgi:large repetitive protein
MNTKTSAGTNFVNRSPLRHGFLLMVLVLACFGLSPQARAVDPPPDGGYWTWKAAGRLNTARFLHTATLLQNGMVLVAGGYDDFELQTASAELYDPAGGTWSTTRSLNTARGYHTATLLRNGRVLVAGGIDGNFNVSASVELYSPASGTWTTTGFLLGARYSHTATSLQNGIVLVAGGLNHNNLEEARAELGRPPP